LFAGASLPVFKTLRIADIHLDFQPPENLIEETVQEYVCKLLCGEAIEPVVVRFDGSRHLLFDGFHRLEAARRVGRQTIEADVSPGTLADMEAEYREAMEQVKELLRQNPTGT
jgi:ParB-like nuclease domain